MMKLKEVALSSASPEAKIAGLALLLDKELLRLSEIVVSTKKLQGPQGEQGLQGPKGEQGDRGLDGAIGKDGQNGKDGLNGVDGQDGVGVADARVDFDGSLVITLTNGKEINAGDVIPEAVADKFKVIKSGGGTSQLVLDALDEINAVIATYGTMATQDKGSVDIEGGTIDGTSIGAAVPATGVFTTLIGGKDQVNYGQLTGGDTTKAVEFKTFGSDTNVALALSSQGTGAIDLAAGSSGVNISNGGTVTAITRTAAGSGYTSAPIVTISAPTTAGGVQATAVARMQIAADPTVTSGGTGYTVNDVLTVVGGTFTTVATFKVTAVSGGVITAAVRNSFGDYTVTPTSPVSVTGGTGSGATFTVTWNVNTTGFTITNAGSGYVEQPTVTFSSGSAAAYASIGSAVSIKTLHGGIGLYGPKNTLLYAADTGNTAQCYMNFQGSNSNTLNYANGSASNVGIYSISKGTGQHSFTTNGSTTTEQLRVSHTSSAVNYVQVTGAATGGLPAISAQGSDTDVSLRYNSKGAGTHLWYNGSGAAQFRVGAVASSANYLRANAAVASASPALISEGSDTNIDLALTPKGTTGRVKFGTYTGTALSIAGYIEIKDSSGTVRKLAVVA